MASPPDDDTPPDRRPETWGAAAADYDERFAVFTRPYAADALDLAGVGPGTRLLDVAAGSGAVSLQAAERGALVLATDFAPGMVELLASRLAAGGHDGSRAAVMDGQALDVADGSFDAAISMFGLMFFPDPLAGLAELRRATRPGGTVVVGVWDLDGVRVTSLIAAALERIGVTPPEASPAHAFLGHAAPLGEALASVGLVDVTVESAAHPWRFTDPEGFLRSAASWSPPVQRMLDQLDDPVREAVIDAFGEVVREHDVQPGGLDVRANLALGLVP